MKTKNGNRGKAKKPKDNSKQSTCSNCRHRAQSLPPPSSSLPPPPPSPKRDQRSTRGEKPAQPTELYSCATVYVRDHPIPHREEGRRPAHHSECPVELQNQQPLSMRARNVLLREMEVEFQNTKKVVISGLPPESNEENLKVFFSEVSCTPVTKIKDGSVRVAFPSHQAANQSISMLNATILNCHQLTASYGHPDSLLFVGNLPFTYTRDDLSRLLSSYGILLRCLVVYSPETGLSKGYGFVEYRTREAAILAKQQMANKVVGLRSLRVDFADNGMQKFRDLQSETLFVDRLPKNFHDEEMLKENFSKYGSVHFCQVALTPSTGAPRGFAFIDMSTPQEAERAQLTYNGTIFAGQQMRVSFGMPCRHGACILHHKPTPMPHPHMVATHHQAPPISCCTTFLKENYPPQWGAHKMMVQGRRASEGCVLAQHIKPRPLVNVTNSKSDTCLIAQRRGSLPHVLEPAHFLHHCCMHSFSMPTLCPHLCHVTSEDHMEEEGDGSAHSHAQDMMLLQDGASGATFIKKHLPPPPTSPKFSTALPSPPLPVSFLPAAGSPRLSSTIKEGKSPVPMPEWEGEGTAWEEPDWDVKGEGEDGEDPIPQAMSQSPPPPSTTAYTIDKPMRIVDSLLGKRQVIQDVWGCDEGGVMGVWGCGEGAYYDQPYIGQHQQGLTYTHPLKRIRMEQY